MYGSARRSVLKQLDPIHHQVLRIALDAFRTSPAQSLYIEAHEPSLTTRRLKLSLNYVLKLKSLPENPAYSCIFEPENKLFEESGVEGPPLGIRILPDLEKSKLNLNLVDDAPSLDIVPWKISVPAVRFDLTNFKKDTTNPEIYKQFYLQLKIISFIRNFFPPTVLKERKELLRRLCPLNELINLFTCQLPDDSSVYTAELRAVLLALKRVYCYKRKIVFDI